MKDEVFSTKTLYQTTNYKQFKPLPGNRPVSQTHVRSLVKKMEREGNKLDKFPVRVNDKKQVIDGQHRLAAAEIGKMPVVYEIDDTGNLETVISGNTGNKNWNWLNFAQSHASRGNKAYEQFLALYDKYPIQYGVLLNYCRLRGVDHSTHDFREGELKIPDIELTTKLLAQFWEVGDIIGIKNREFANAMLKHMRTPYYDHEAMIAKILRYASRLDNCYFVTDYTEALEEIRRTT